MAFIQITDISSSVKPRTFCLNIDQIDSLHQRKSYLQIATSRGLFKIEEKLDDFLLRMMECEKAQR